MAGLMSKPTPTVQQGRHDFLETPKYIGSGQEAAAPKEQASASGSSRRRRKPTAKQSITLLGDDE